MRLRVIRQEICQGRYKLVTTIPVGKFSHIGRTLHKRYPHASIHYDGSAFLYGVTGSIWPSHELYLSRRTVRQWLES